MALVVGDIKVDLGHEGLQSEGGFRFGVFVQRFKRHDSRSFWGTVQGGTLPSVKRSQQALFQGVRPFFGRVLYAS